MLMFIKAHLKEHYNFDYMQVLASEGYYIIYLNYKGISVQFNFTETLNTRYDLDKRIIEEFKKKGVVLKMSLEKKYSIDDIIQLLSDKIENYRDCTIKNLNMTLDIRTDEEEIKMIELLVKIIKNNTIVKEFIKTDMYLLQSNIGYKGDEENE